MIALLLYSTTMSAHDFEVDGIYYNITSSEDLTVEVTYKGSTINSGVYHGYVVIPENIVYNGSNYEVTGIGAHAFDYCISLINVIIPSSVTSIGNYAFYGCGVNFTKITIPNSVTSIGDYAFYGCDFTEVIIPNSVTSIGGYAFAECFELTSITIPNSVTSIESYAFWNCIHLTSVHITDLEAWCKIIFNEPHSNPLGHAHHLYLKGEEIKSLVIPESVTNIGDNTFSGCYGFTDITIPNSVTSIGNHAFSSCKGLTDITIPNSVTSIEYGAFWGCN